MSFAYFYCSFPFPLSPPLFPLALFLSPLHLLCKEQRSISHNTTAENAPGYQKGLQSGIERRDFKCQRGSPSGSTIYLSLFPVFAIGKKMPQRENSTIVI